MKTLKICVQQPNTRQRSYQQGNFVSVLNSITIIIVTVHYWLLDNKIILVKLNNCHKWPISQCCPKNLKKKQFPSSCSLDINFLFVTGKGNINYWYKINSMDLNLDYTLCTNFVCSKYVPIIIQTNHLFRSAWQRVRYYNIIWRECEKFIKTNKAPSHSYGCCNICYVHVCYAYSNILTEELNTTKLTKFIDTS